MNKGDFVDEQIKDTPDEFANSPAADPAEAILRQAPELTEAMRETLWTVFHSKRTPEELAKVLEHFSASTKPNTRCGKRKKLTAPEPTPLDRTLKAIRSVAQMNLNILKIAESHPVVLKALVDSAISKGKS